MGMLTAAGADGDELVLQFNRARAAVWYMGADKVTLRPYFPYRPASDQAISDFFCPGCGILLDSYSEFLERGMPRDEGFRLCAEVLHSGALPTEVPEDRTDQPLLPGMEAFAEELARGRAVEWRVHRTATGDLAEPR
jgi:hypothetical protein